MSRLLITLFALIIGQTSAFAQDVVMADNMRSDGKIYVVVAVLATIFLGLVVYLISLDKKVSKLEKQLKK